jgi:hypothetical protein
LGSLSVLNAATFCNDVEVRSNANLLGSLSVLNAATFCNDVEVSSNANLLGSLSVLNAATFCNDVEVRSNANLLGSLSVLNAATFCNDVEVRRNANLLGSLSVLNAATFCNDVEVLGQLSISATATFCNDVNFRSRLNVLGPFSALGLATLCNNATVRSNLNVLGQVSVLRAATFCNDVEVTGQLSVCAGAAFCNEVHCREQLSVMGPFSALGLATFCNDTNVCSNLSVFGDLTAASSTFTGTSSLCNVNVHGHTTFNSSIEARGPCLVHSSLALLGPATFCNAQAFHGPTFLFDTLHAACNMSAPRLNVDEVVVANSGRFYGVATFDSARASNLIVDGDTRMYGETTVDRLYTDEITCVGESFLDRLEAGDISASNVDVFGQLIVDDITSFGCNMSISVQGQPALMVSSAAVEPFVAASTDLGSADRRFGTVFADAVDSVNGVAQLSDPELKTSEPLTRGLAELMRLDAIKYSWKSRGLALDAAASHGRDSFFGVNAAQVRSVLPELVADRLPLRINYSELIPVIINAIKELNAVVQAKISPV